MELAVLLIFVEDLILKEAKATIRAELTQINLQTQKMLAQLKIHKLKINKNQLKLQKDRVLGIKLKEIILKQKLMIKNW